MVWSKVTIQMKFLLPSQFLTITNSLAPDVSRGQKRMRRAKHECAQWLESRVGAWYVKSGCSTYLSDSLTKEDSDYSMIRNQWLGTGVGAFKVAVPIVNLTP